MTEKNATLIVTHKDAISIISIISSHVFHLMEWIKDMGQGKEDDKDWRNFYGRILLDTIVLKNNISKQIEEQIKEE